MATIASELTEEKELFLAYDQWIHLGPVKNSPLITAYCAPEATLEKVSSLSDIACGLLLCLSPSVSLPSPLPKQGGEVLFLAPQTALHLPQKLKEEVHYLLIVYGKPHSQYIKNPQDPCTHFLKHQGHIFGTALKNIENPQFII